MALTTAALVFSTLLAAFATIRLNRLGVYRTLPVLYSFICYQLFQGIVGIFLSPASVSSEVYQWAYVWAEPLNWVFEILMVRELYRIVFRDHKGVASLARWNSYGAAVLAVLICGLVLYSHPANALSYDSVFSSVVLWETSVSFVLALFVVLLAVLLSRFPLRIPLNAGAHAIIFTVFFFANFLIFQIGTLPSPAFWKIRYFGANIIYAAGFLAWGLVLKKDSEIQTISLRPAPSSSERDKLMDELSVINGMLGKSVRQ